MKYDWWADTVSGVMVHPRGAPQECRGLRIILKSVMAVSALLLLLLQPPFANGARHYSTNTQSLLVVADVCGNNPNEVSQSYRARYVHKAYFLLLSVINLTPFCTD